MTSCPDTTSLLPRLAPRLPLLPHNPLPRPPRLPNRHHPNGQAQTHLGPLHRLRRLRGRHKLHRCSRHGQEASAEAVLQADHAAGGAEEYEYGGDDQEVGWGGGVEEGG